VRGLPITLVYGDEDEYVKTADVEKQRDFLRQLGVEPDIIGFTGKHTLQTEVLLQLAGQRQ